jgi:hypothetical protein
MPVVTQSGNLLSSSSAVQYQWYLNNIAISGATSQQYLAMLSGDYYVVVTDAGGCTAASLVKRVSLVGIEENENELSFSIFPNPARDHFSITIFAIKPMDLTLSLYDAIGNRIYFDFFSMNSTKEVFYYNVEDLSNGIYFFRVESDSHRWIKPLLKD